MDNEISDRVRRILATGISSMDHVDVLFHLSRGDLTRSELAESTRFGKPVIDVLVARLISAGLVVQQGDVLAMTRVLEDRRCVDELLAVYNSRPVTLVRAIYAGESLTVTDAITPRRET
jgi:hypothetical protein